MATQSVLTKTVKEVYQWRIEKDETKSRLFLPPIQRSLVWTNEQIVNFWDSLLRGYPIGMMMVHQINHQASTQNQAQGINAQGQLETTKANDYQLFDGQQRLSTILLGFNEGILANSKRLWLDIGSDPTPNSGYLFQLRISSEGQPFGYDPNEPNNKIPLNKRRDCWEKWRNKNPEITQSKSVFQKAEGSDLADAKNAILLSDLLEKLIRGENLKDFFLTKGVNEQQAAKLVNGLNTAINIQIVFQTISEEIIKNSEAYTRLFARIGQGGTRLSEDELTYSLIKYHYPQVRPAMEKISADPEIGRLSGEVDLTLGALRLAKYIAPWQGAKNWEIASRPEPKFISQLQQIEKEGIKEKEELKNKFLALINSPDNQAGENPKSLKNLLKNIRAALIYSKEDNPIGLPAILLGRLPKYLVDLLLLFACQEDKQSLGEKKKLLSGFVLYYLLAVDNDERASRKAFELICNKEKGWHFDETTVIEIINYLESHGAIKKLPSLENIKCLIKFNDEKKSDVLLRPWEQRFNQCDTNYYLPGERIRFISTHREKTKLLLMWLQRDYLDSQFPNYDPTSERDEDLPVDLDHLIPQKRFAFNWGDRLQYLTEELVNAGIKEIDEHFRGRRTMVGNSLGNFRWLDAAANRARQADELVPIDGGLDFVDVPNDWNALIPTNENPLRWGETQIASFQYLIDNRTLQIFNMVQQVLEESGIFASTNPQKP